MKFDDETHQPIMEETGEGGSGTTLVVSERNEPCCESSEDFALLSVVIGINIDDNNKNIVDDGGDKSTVSSSSKNKSIKKPIKQDDKNTSLELEKSRSASNCSLAASINETDDRDTSCSLSLGPIVMDGDNKYIGGVSTMRRSKSKNEHVKKEKKPKKSGSSRSLLSNIHENDDKDKDETSITSHQSFQSTNSKKTTKPKDKKFVDKFPEIIVKEKGAISAALPALFADTATTSPGDPANFLDRKEAYYSKSKHQKREDKEEKGTKSKRCISVLADTGDEASVSSHKSRKDKKKSSKNCKEQSAFKECIPTVVLEERVNQDDAGAGDTASGTAATTVLESESTPPATSNKAWLHHKHGEKEDVPSQVNNNDVDIAGDDVSISSQDKSSKPSKRKGEKSVRSNSSRSLVNNDDADIAGDESSISRHRKSSKSKRRHERKALDANSLSQDADVDKETLIKSSRQKHANKEKKPEKSRSRRALVPDDDSDNASVSSDNSSKRTKKKHSSIHDGILDTIAEEGGPAVMDNEPVVVPHADTVSPDSPSRMSVEPNHGHFGKDRKEKMEKRKSSRLVVDAGNEASVSRLKSCSKPKKDKKSGNRVKSSFPLVVTEDIYALDVAEGAAGPAPLKMHHGDESLPTQKQGKKIKEARSSSRSLAPGDKAPATDSGILSSHKSMKKTKRKSSNQDMFENSSGMVITGDSSVASHTSSKSKKKHSKSKRRDGGTPDDVLLSRNSNYDDDKIVTRRTSSKLDNKNANGEEKKLSPDSAGVILKDDHVPDRKTSTIGRKTREQDDSATAKKTLRALLDEDDSTPNIPANSIGNGKEDVATAALNDRDRNSHHLSPNTDQKTTLSNDESGAPRLRLASLPVEQNSRDEIFVAPEPLASPRETAGSRDSYPDSYFQVKDEITPYVGNIWTEERYCNRVCLPTHPDRCGASSLLDQTYPRHGKQDDGTLEPERRLSNFMVQVEIACPSVHSNLALVRAIRKDGAAAILQAQFRGRLVRSNYKACLAAAVVIQSFARRVRAQQLVQAVHLASREKASIVIQRAARRILALLERSQRRNYYYKKAATLIQALWRGVHARMLHRRYFVAVISVQSFARCVLAKRLAKAIRLERNMQAATIIQLRWRYHKASIPYHRNKSASKIQAQWRRYILAILLQESFAARKIQRSWRRFEVLIIYKNHKAAWTIQCAWLVFKARRQLEQHLAARKIQSSRRRYEVLIVYKNFKAARVIQCAWFVFKARGQREEHLARKIQSCWRRYKVLQIYKPYNTWAERTPTMGETWVADKNSTAAPRFGSVFSTDREADSVVSTNDSLSASGTCDAASCSPGHSSWIFPGEAVRTAAMKLLAKSEGLDLGDDSSSESDESSEHITCSRESISTVTWEKHETDGAVRTDDMHHSSKTAHESQNKQCLPIIPTVRTDEGSNNGASGAFSVDNIQANSPLTSMANAPTSAADRLLAGEIIAPEDAHMHTIEKLRARAEQMEDIRCKLISKISKLETVLTEKEKEIKLLYFLDNSNGTMLQEQFEQVITTVDSCVAPLVGRFKYFVEDLYRKYVSPQKTIVYKKNGSMLNRLQAGEVLSNEEAQGLTVLLLAERAQIMQEEQNLLLQRYKTLETILDDREAKLKHWRHLPSKQQLSTKFLI